MTFNAKAVKIVRDSDGSWSSSYVTICSVDDIFEQFSPYRDTVTQVNFDKYHKLYYSLFDTDIMVARTKDEFGETHYMTSPLLLVQCDDEKPIDITAKFEADIKGRIALL